MLKGAWPFAKILVDINKFPSLFLRKREKDPLFVIATNKKLRE